MIEAIADVGLKRIRVTSFVHPKLVPQMVDAEDICKDLDKSRNVLYSALVLNTKSTIVQRMLASNLWTPPFQPAILTVENMPMPRYQKIDDELRK